MKDCGLHCEHVCTWVDDVLHAGKSPKEFCDASRTMGFALKQEEEPKHHLGGDFERVEDPEEMLCWGATTCAQRMLENYKTMLGEDAPESETHAPSEPGDHPELDDSSLSDKQGTAHHWQMMGELQWAVALGRMDLCFPTVAMARLRPAPHQGHLDRLKRMHVLNPVGLAHKTQLRN